MHLEVGASLENERIDRVVALVVGCTRAEAARLVDEGAVRLGGTAVTTRSRRVHAGDLVEVDAAAALDAPVDATGPERGIEFEIVYEDEDLLVVDKPTGLVVHPGAGNQHGTLVSGLLERYPDLAGVGEAQRPGIVHRLDKATSGLLVVARTEPTYAALIGQLSRREMGREYAALVVGSLGSDEGLIDAPIGRSLRDRTRMAIEATGREARTHYVVESRFQKPLQLTLVGVRLETGRTHQIRVHFAAIGHPVAGDGDYKARPVIEGLNRPFLHARRLRLVHPRTGEQLEFSSPLPDDLVEVLERLEA